MFAWVVHLHAPVVIAPSADGPHTCGRGINVSQWRSAARSWRDRIERRDVEATTNVSLQNDSEPKPSPSAYLVNATLIGLGLDIGSGTPSRLASS